MIESSRRDPRYPLQPGIASVTLDGGDPAGPPLRGDVIELSAAGLRFVLHSGCDIASGTLLRGVRVEIGSCPFDGDLRVSSAVPVDGARVALGCLFYPSSAGDTARWMALIAGARVTRGD
jgi:hypothetical protein